MPGHNEALYSQITLEIADRDKMSAEKEIGQEVILPIFRQFHQISISKMTDEEWAEIARAGPGSSATRHVKINQTDLRASPIEYTDGSAFVPLFIRNPDESYFELHVRMTLDDNYSLVVRQYDLESVDVYSSYEARQLIVTATEDVDGNGGHMDTQGRDPRKIALQLIDSLIVTKENI